MKHKFVIFGKIIHTDFFIKLLHEYGFPRPLVIVSLDEEYYRDEKLLSPLGLYSKVETLAERGLCNLYKMKTVNCQEAIELFNRYKVNMAISINCRNIIKKKIIDYFDAPILNLHDSYLPDERGGALNSWRILNGISEVGNTLHVIDEGIDTGPILLRQKVSMQLEKPYPIDYMRAEVSNCEKILRDYIKALVDGAELTAHKQKNDDSYYFPRLHTEVNGLINWDWDVNSVEKFIRAFSHPYPGAYSFYRGSKIHILSAFVEKSGYTFHPFANGKIVTILDNQSVRVVAGGKPLIIEQIVSEGTILSPGMLLKVKNNFCSPNDQLTNARHHVPTTLSMNNMEAKS